MILVIDNYDSFTYNLVQYLGELLLNLEGLSPEIQVVRNDQVSVSNIAAKRPLGIVISPGPGRPEEAGVSMEVIRRLGSSIPILGVCLGHQCIGQVFGGRIIQARTLMHGKTSRIYHQGQGVFQGLDNPFQATRYHSLVIAKESCPKVLDITAWVEDGAIMGVRHREFPHLQGVQFHPESILTTAGKPLLKNFLISLRQPAAKFA